MIKLPSIAVILFALCISNCSISSELPIRKQKLVTEYKPTKLQIGFGMSGSVLYLSRNVKEDNDAKGYTFSANYGGTRFCRISAQYTYYQQINIEPTWYTIKANTIESNLEILARFKNNKTFLYPFIGLSYNTFEGFFTGRNDYLNLKEKYKSNSNVTSRWLGVNIGTGIEHTIGPVVLFFDYRMRLGQMEKFGNYNIMDVCYGGGLRLKIYRVKLKPIKKIFHDFRNRYNVT